MVLELLKCLKRPEHRILIIQTADKADRDAILVEVIDKTAAVDFSGQRPADTVLDQTGLDPAFGQTPELLETDTIGLRIAIGIQPVFLDGPLGQVPAAALTEHR